MTTLLMLLTVLGGAASFAGVLWIVVAAHRGVLRLRDERQRILEWPASDNKADEMRAAGLDFTTYDDLLMLKQDVALAILESARLSAPVALTLAGIAISTVASCGSLL